MHARTTTVSAAPAAIDAGITHVCEEVLPQLMQIPGCVGLSMLVDRESGRCIVTAAWESEDAMRASAQTVMPLRDRAVELLGGTAAVREWEVAVMHRTHPSTDHSCVRVTWFRSDPANVDPALDYYRLSVLPRLEQFEGFCSASLLVDRTTGDAVSSVTFESLQGVERSRETAAGVRAAATQEAGIEITDVAEFELALAHLHVPEMV